MGILAFVSMVAGSVFLNASFPLEKRYGNLLSVAVLCYSQIVLFSTILSEFKAIGLTGFLTFHLLLLFLGIFLWMKRGRQAIFSLYFPEKKEIFTFVQRNSLTVLFLVILTGMLVLGSLFFPFTPGDAAKYHLPRAHYWIQNLTARHFYSDDYRQVEFPPNSSFIYMWQILVTNSYRGLHVAQWLAAWLTALGIAAISRSIGHSRGASLFAFGIYISLPGIVLQMSTPLNDLITAFCGITFVYFALEAILASELGSSELGWRNILMSSLAFGLFLGSKLTAVFLLPVLVISLFTIFVFRPQICIRKIAALAFTCLLGFGLLGSYNYILNYIEFRHPIASEDARYHALIDMQSRLNEGAEEEARSPIGNLLRYSYQIMDWKIYEPIPGIETLYAMNNSIYSFIDDEANLLLSTVSTFDYSDFGMRSVIAGEVGYGFLGYGLVLVSPLVFLGFLFHPRKRRKIWVSIFLILLSTGWVVAFSSIVPWTPVKVRYFTFIMALLIAALVPWIYSRKPIAMLWLIPIMFIAIWSVLATVRVNIQFAREDRTLEPWQIGLLDKSIPPNARIAIAGPVEFNHYLKQYSDLEFFPFEIANIQRSLKLEEIDAALIYDPEDRFRDIRLLLEHDQSFLVINSGDIFLENLSLYGVEIVSHEDKSMLHIKGGALIKRLGPDLVRIFIPTVEPIKTSSYVSIAVLFPVRIGGEETLSVFCEGKEVEMDIAANKIVGEISIPFFNLAHPYQVCELRIRDLEFGGNISSESIDAFIYFDE